MDSMYNMAQARAAESLRATAPQSPQTHAAPPRSTKLKQLHSGHRIITVWWGLQRLTRQGCSAEWPQVKVAMAAPGEGQPQNTCPQHRGRLGLEILSFTESITGQDVPCLTLRQEPSGDTSGPDATGEAWSNRGGGLGLPRVQPFVHSVFIVCTASASASFAGGGMKESMTRLLVTMSVVRMTGRTLSGCRASASRSDVISAYVQPPSITISTVCGGTPSACTPARDMLAGMRGHRRRAGDRAECCEDAGSGVGGNGMCRG